MPSKISWKVFIIRRILGAIPLILSIVILNFLLIHLAPGDPVYWLIGEIGDPEIIRQTRIAFGLDRPLHEQLFIYLGNVLRGDLGYSYWFRQPVLNILIERLPATFLLVFSSIFFAIVVGVLLGVFSARKPYSFGDNFATIVSLVGYSMPVFWFALMLILIFSIYLRWFPAIGMVSPDITGFSIDYLINVLHHLVLPVLTLGGVFLGLETRITRSSMIESLSKDYIVTARAKGLRERDVLFKHALRNALIPIVTVTSTSLSLVIGGAILTEIVFSWPGLGNLMYNALIRRDYGLLMGMFIFMAISTVIINLITDVIYALLDPRVRYK